MKKGFTLIELLAVIVILAIIALIAFPTISGIVEKAKKGGAEQSANGYNDAINKQIALNQMDSNNENDINKGIIDAPFAEKYNLKAKGQTPKKGWAEVLKDGVYRYSYVIGEYVVSYDGDKVTVVKGTEPNSKPSFATDSWEVIINNVRNGNANVYNLGDTKEVDMGEFGTRRVRIANMSTPSECLTEGFSQTACGFVLEFSDIITNHPMVLTYGTNKGGWPSTYMREYINSDIYNSLPNDLKIGIMDTFVVSGHGSKEYTNFITTDKLYLLSDKEVGEYLIPERIDDSSATQTRQLDYYKELFTKYNGYSIKNDKSQLALDVNTDGWWLRSTSPKIDHSYDYISFGQTSLNGDFSFKSLGVSPAFRIG